MKSIQSQIMRRVYYSYALSYAEQPMLLVGLLLGGAVALFGRVTHVASITDNLLAIPLGNVPGYVSNAFLSAIARGELGTVLAILTIASLSAVAVHQLSNLRWSHRLRTA
jgi:hypothetical protein